MNKKGFTMVELLVAISIMAILSGVGVASVSRYLDRSKENAFENMGKTLYESTKQYFISNSSKIPSVGNSTIIKASTLVDEGYTEILKNPRNENENCHDSEVKVSREELNQIDEEGNPLINYNMDLTYDITIICNGSKEREYKYPKD